MKCVVALTQIVYGGKTYEEGQEFEAHDTEAEGMIITGKAKSADKETTKKAPPPIPEPPAVSRQTYAAPVESTAVEPMKIDDLSGRPKQTYRRRDMKPQG